MQQNVFGFLDNCVWIGNGKILPITTIILAVGRQRVNQWHLKELVVFLQNKDAKAQLIITCSKLTIKILENDGKHVQSIQ